MKKLFLFGFACMLFSFIAVDGPLTKKERKQAVALLTEGRKSVEKSVQGLSESQLSFTSDTAIWGVEGTLKHIAISEQMIWGMIDEALRQPGNPEKRANIKVTDEQLIANLQDRSNKVKTMDPMKPENTPFKTAAEALASFIENREKLIAFVNSTPEDLRNHVMELPFGTYDAYQVILLMGLIPTGT